MPNFKTLNGKGDLVLDYPNKMCYSDITYRSIPETVQTIVLYETSLKIQDPKPWITLITKMGFPVEYRYEKNYHTFIINLDNYEYKVHLTSTLTLIRYLFEGYGYQIIENTFRFIDKFNLEPFKALLMAECLEKNGNTNHKLTTGAYIKFIDKAEVFQNFTNYVKVRDVLSLDIRSHFGPVNTSWMDKRLPCKNLEGVRTLIDPKELLKLM